MKNFEDFTQPLNSDEHRIALIICRRFKSKPGKKNIVTNKEMIAGLRNKYSIKITEPRIRKIIQFIRANGWLTGLIATSSGYYLTENEEDLKSWIESMIERENAIRHSRQAGERDLRIIQDRNKGSQPSLF